MREIVVLIYVSERMAGKNTGKPRKRGLCIARAILDWSQDGDQTLRRQMPSKANSHGKLVSFAGEEPSVTPSTARMRFASPEPYETRFDYDYRARHFQIASQGQPVTTPVKCPSFSSKK